MKSALDYFHYLVDEIHTVIVATIDEEGHPVTAAIDMMDADERGLYFLTARGKGFYRRLVDKKYLALTGIKGESTMTRTALSVRGEVEELGPSYLDRLLSKNPYMYEIYPSEESRKALTVFRLYRGEGEWFDLSKKPIERDSFTFGGSNAKTEVFTISDACIGCGNCVSACPQGCIDTSSVPFRIEAEHCLHCARCSEVCPAGAVERRKV